MPADRIAVPPELAGSGTYLRGRASTLSGDLDRLRTRVATLMEMWSKGEARTEYLGYQTKWDTSAKALMGPDGILVHIAAAMDRVWANFVEVEQTNARGWRT